MAGLERYSSPIHQIPPSHCHLVCDSGCLEAHPGGPSHPQPDPSLNAEPLRNTADEQTPKISSKSFVTSLVNIHIKEMSHSVLGVNDATLIML